MPNQIDRRDLRLAACEFARVGAAVAEAMFGTVETSRKADDTPVTEADHAAQEAILREVGRRYPGHGIIVEELVARPEWHAGLDAAEYCWVIDPIDGTRNYGRGVRMYGTTVAVLRSGVPVAGAVYDANLKVMYSASEGEGAFRDESPLRLRERVIDGDTTIAISSFRRRTMPVAVRGWMERYLFRNQGAVSLHLAGVAAGLIDGAISVDCKLWDIAAAALLIEKAGGRISGLQGEPLWPIEVAAYAGGDLPVVAGHPLLHAELIRNLREG
jgi:myo-inositol-1(or 4)-monophosphatase